MSQQPGWAAPVSSASTGQAGLAMSRDVEWLGRGQEGQNRRSCCTLRTSIPVGILEVAVLARAH